MLANTNIHYENLKHIHVCHTLNLFNSNNLVFKKIQS